METKQLLSSPGIYKISCSHVPAELLQKHVAKQHFKQFGHVVRIILRPKSGTCVIEYNNETSVQRAVLQGGQFNGKPFHITRYLKPLIKTKRVKKETDPEWMPDLDVQAELEAMGSYGVKNKYNLRPEQMIVDAEPEMKQVKNRTWKKAAKPKTTVKSAVKVSCNLKLSEIKELLSVLKQPAITTEERYKALEARDKLIRSQTRKHTDLSEAGRAVGTCPDMCPEKERLMRDAQHQVALYEQNAGCKGMNPKLAVKQYSRSSADQEFPLPHELRPVSVLQLTMGYLMHKIMNLCNSPDVNLSDWYHFLWDRMRGIRKDITQLELCCQDSVQLVEQCARFHIHCSARLVAEDPSVFDHKINTENLTKCLQTLKYMYHDLSLKGEQCPNESEFRAYIILLNLNDGNFVWELQRLKPNIKKSHEVAFALKVYSAIDKNNYIKFFKLVRSTTYLNACILLRYFVQVRLGALRIILKSYSPRATCTIFPLGELTNVLAFEDEQATVEFLEYFNLGTNDERTHVILDKKKFHLPKMPYTLDRAMQVVESKLKCSVGEVVCGSPLPYPHFETHVPQNSFDNDGFVKNRDEFIRDFETADDTTESVEKPVFKPVGDFVAKLAATADIADGRSKSPLFVERKTPSPVPKTNIFNTTTGIFNLPPKESVQCNIFSNKPVVVPSIFGQLPPSTSNTTFVSKTFDIFKPRFEEPVKQVPITPPPPPVTTTQLKNEDRDEIKLQLIQQQQNEEAERKRKEEEEKEKAKKHQEMMKIRQENILKKKLEQQQKFIEEKRKQEEESRLKREKMLNLQIKQDVSIVLDKLLVEVEEKISQERLSEIADKIKKYKTHLMLNKWLNKMRANKRKRKVVDCSPAWLTTRNLKEEARELFTSSQQETLKYSKRYKYGKALNLLPPPVKEIQEIDLFDLTYHNLVKRFAEIDKLQRDIYWKVDVSFPLTSNRITETLNDFFQWQENNGHCTVIKQTKQSSLPQITYCIEKHLQSTDANAIIFIAYDFDEFFLNRVGNCLMLLQPLAKVPVVFIIQNNDCDETKLERFSNCITIYKILSNCFTANNLVGLVEEALLFLAKNAVKQPPLQLDLLSNFLYRNLCTEIWLRITSFANWNPSYKLCLTSPEAVVNLHNETIDILESIIFKSINRNYADFPIVFRDFLKNAPDYLPCDFKYFPSFWKSDDYQQSLRNMLLSFKLPSYTKTWPPKNASSLERDIYDYCKKNFTNPETPFYKIMAVILKNVESDFSEIKKMPWTNIVEVIALCKLDVADFSIPPSIVSTEHTFTQHFVVYDIKDLNDYNASTWFYVNNPIIKNRMKTDCYSTAFPQKSRSGLIYEPEMNIDLDKTLSEASAWFLDEEKISTTKTQLHEMEILMDDLEESMRIQKLISRRFEATLESALNE